MGASAKAALCFLSVTLCAPSVWAAPPFVRAWGTFGGGDGEFVGPRSIDLASDGRVFVLDNQLKRVQSFTSLGKFVTKFGTSGSGEGELRAPIGLTVGAGDMVYVADGVRVVQFTSAGSFVRQWGTEGSGNGQFHWVTDITSDESGNIYVVDMFDVRIQKFDAQGGYLTQWPLGIAGPSSGRSYLSCDANGNIHAAIMEGGPLTGHMRVFDSNGSTVLEAEGVHYTTNGIAVSHLGEIHVARGGCPCVERYDASWAFLEAWGASGSGDGEFSSAADLVESQGGELFVIDGARRIQVFETAAVPARMTTWGRLKADRR